MNRSQSLAILLVIGLCVFTITSAGPIFSGPPGGDSELIPSLQTILRLVGIGRMTDPVFDRVKSRWDKLIFRQRHKNVVQQKLVKGLELLGTAVKL